MSGTVADLELCGSGSAADDAEGTGYASDNDDHDHTRHGRGTHPSGISSRCAVHATTASTHAYSLSGEHGRPPNQRSFFGERPPLPDR